MNIFRLAVNALLLSFFLQLFPLPLAYAADEQPLVVVSIPPQKFFVERIAGALVKIDVFLPPGANPHSFEPTINKLASISRAALYVKLGHRDFVFENRLVERLLKTQRNLKAISMAEGLPLEDEDPHFWLSCAAGRQMARKTAEGLADLLPERKQELEKNLAALIADINQLETSLHELFLHDAQSRFLVYHPAWGYFAKEYGLIQVAIEHHGKEPGAFRTEQIVAQAKKVGFKIIYVQPQFARKSAEAIAAEMEVNLEVLDPLAEDWLANMKNTGKAIKRGLVR